MVCSKVHMIHVGNMANKGTQALLMSDVSVIGEVIARALLLSPCVTPNPSRTRIEIEG